MPGAGGNRTMEGMTGLKGTKSLRAGQYGVSEAAIIADSEGLRELEEEWRDLYHDAPLATPYQSWAWLYSWWEHYGEGYELRLVTIRVDDLLVGVLPLMLERGTGRLLFLGSGITNHLDVVARNGWEEEVGRAGAEALRGMRSWRVADLWQLRPEAAAWYLYRSWDKHRLAVWQGSCQMLDLEAGWEELLSSLSQKFRSNVRRALRRAEQDGGHWEPAPPELAEEAARTLVALHRESWEGREIGPEHLTQRFEAHLRTAARRMSAQGLGTVSELRRDGEVIASHLVIFGKDFVEGYLAGATKEASRRYSIDALCVRDLVSASEALDVPRASIGRGEESYKLRWRPKITPSRRVILARSAPIFAPYAAYHLLYSKARIYVNSDDASPRVRQIADKLRSLRFALSRRRLARAAGAQDPGTPRSQGGTAGGGAVGEDRT